MKTVLICVLIIIISININAQSDNNLIKYDGLLALFEKKFESVYDATKEEFILLNKKHERNILRIKDSCIYFNDKKYIISDSVVDSDIEKSDGRIFYFIEYTCYDDDGEEQTLEVTKSENIIYGIRIYVWADDKTLFKYSYQH